MAMSCDKGIRTAFGEPIGEAARRLVWQAEEAARKEAERDRRVAWERSERERAEQVRAMSLAELVDAVDDAIVDMWESDSWEELKRRLAALSDDDRYASVVELVDTVASKAAT